MESYLLLGRLEALLMLTAIFAGMFLFEVVILPCFIAAFARVSPVKIAGDIIEMGSLGHSRSPWSVAAIFAPIYALCAVIIFTLPDFFFLNTLFFRY